MVDTIIITKKEDKEWGKDTKMVKVEEIISDNNNVMSKEDISIALGREDDKCQLIEHSNGENRK